MPLTSQSEIAAQEELFRSHCNEFFSVRTEDSLHPEQCIDLLKEHFSRKLGLDPEVNFFAYNSLSEFKEKRNEIELLSNYEEVDRKTRRYQPRAALNAYEKFLKRYGVDADLHQDEIFEESYDMDLSPVQKIFFGAPGTGKSHKLDYDLFKDVNVKPLGKGLKSVSQDYKFRTTFHPDYDYAQFVGSYKPKKEGSSITYSFVPQVFAKTYVAAWNKFIAADKKSTADNQVYLVIEEINRGNCAQIFGDLFQLLDRDEKGYSSYEIEADADFAEWIEKQLDSSAAPQNDIPDEICSGRKLRLPPNFNILATMNTSDQSLFPMDSAFKRRFDWEYVPIKYAKDADCGDSWNADKFVIKLDDDTCYSWLDFLSAVNDDIYEVTQSEDKQMGEFFVKPKDNEIDQDMFLSKVMFYLWDSVYKDEVDKENVFHFDWTFANGKKSTVTFQSLFKNKNDAVEILKTVMENLKVETI